MTGGLAVRKNLLCVTWSSARGHVFLFDLQTGVPTSSWELPAAATGYSDAAGVAMDDRFHLFVADPHQDRVHHFSAFGRHLGSVGRAAEPGGSASRDREGVLWRPLGVALCGDELVIVGGERPARRSVQRFARDGRALGHLRSNGEAEGDWGAPCGVFADAHGVLVADTLHGSVQRFRRDGRFVAAFACGGGDLRARPIAVARTRDGRIVVVDGGDAPGVRAFTAEGREVAAGDLPARALQPSALAIDEHDRVYLLDRDGERVQRFAPDLTFDSLVVDLAEHLDGFPGRTP